MIAALTLTHLFVQMDIVTTHDSRRIIERPERPGQGRTGFWFVAPCDVNNSCLAWPFVSLHASVSVPNFDGVMEPGVSVRSRSGE